MTTDSTRQSPAATVQPGAAASASADTVHPASPGLGPSFDMSAQALPTPEPAEPIVTVDQVSKRFGRGPLVLEQVSLQVTPGEFVCLIGASGCGKSTLLNLIAGLDAPSSGQLTAPPAAVMFQESALMPWLSAQQNVELALRLRGVGRATRGAEALALLDSVNLAEAAEKRPHELSGGMRQRVALARALAQDRPVLLMDEPFAALDAITRDLLHEELRRVWRETGRTIVFVTHNVSEAVRLGERIVLLASRPGRVAAQWRVSPAVRRGDAIQSAALTNEITDRLRQEISRNAS